MTSDGLQGKVIVQLLGGLGNQMFQYAAAKRLAIEKNTPLMIDISSFETYSLRKYGLSNFRVNAKIADSEVLLRFKHPSRFSQLVEKVQPYYKRHIFNERLWFYFDPNILLTPNQVYLRGYFQNEAYFKSIEKLLREDFSLKATPSLAATTFASQINNIQSVSLHVRRGDYSTNPAALHMHGLLPISYYEEVINQIINQVERAVFVVFSDDIGWVKENLKFSVPVIWVNGLPDYEDLWLMSLCKHHIVANSSFSWWGAWLSTNRPKLVYAPDPWFANPPTPTGDIVPHNWHKISTTFITS